MKLTSGCTIVLDELGNIEFKDMQFEDSYAGEKPTVGTALMAVISVLELKLHTDPHMKDPLFFGAKGEIK